MSFEVFLQCLPLDSPGIPRAEVWRLFAEVVVKEEPEIWEVRYDDLNGCTIYLGSSAANSERIGGFTVSRPCVDARLWSALFQVLQMGPVVLFYPGCSGPVLTDEAAIQLMPADMLQSLGTPHIVHSGEEIVKLIRCD